LPGFNHGFDLEIFVRGGVFSKQKRLEVLNQQALPLIPREWEGENLPSFEQQTNK
jgi:hypothetical protein